MFSSKDLWEKPKYEIIGVQDFESQVAGLQLYYKYGHL